MAPVTRKSAKIWGFDPMAWLASLAQSSGDVEAAPVASKKSGHPTRRLAADHKVKPSKKARAARAKAKRLNTTKRRSH